MTTDIWALIGVAAGGITNGIVSGITLGWPTRPKWVAFVAALVVGILAAAIGAIAYLPPDVAFTRQTYGQLVIVGIGAGLAAAGLGVAQSSAEAHRQAAAAITSEPDPVTPTPQGGNG